MNLFKINGEVTTDSSVIANGFCKFFSEIGSSILTTSQKVGSITWSNFTLNLKPIVNPLDLTFKFKFKF